MHKKALILILALLCGLAIWQASSNIISQSVADISDLSESESEDYIETHYDDYSTFCEEIVAHNINLFGNHIVRYNGDTLRVGDINNKGDLWVRFCAGSCSSCIDSITSYLLQIKERYPEVGIKIVVSNIDSRSLYVMEHLNPDKMQFFKADILPVDYDDSGYTPMAFRLNLDGSVKSACIYDRDMPDRFIKYINESEE